MCQWNYIFEIEMSEKQRVIGKKLNSNRKKLYKLIELHSLRFR